MKFLKSVSNSMIKKLSPLAVALLLPAIGICQDPPGPGGDPPDGVPFDGTMNLIFLAIGLLFAAVVLIKRMQKKKATA